MGDNWLIMLCGIPGSGKSTLSKKFEGVVVSTDALRKCILNDENDVEHDKLIFHVGHIITDYFLARGEDVIFDATNLKKEKRRDLISIAHKNDARVKLIFVNCPLEVALERNAARERRVPPYIIKNLLKGFDPPQLEEGIDIIEVRNEFLELMEVKKKDF